MSTMDEAARDWREGRLIAARQKYQAITTKRPEEWGAWFQLAWLDAAFGRLDRGQVERLKRPNLNESARHMIQALDGMADHPTPLEGSLEDWDIDHLHQAGDAEQYSSWWEAKGRQAAKAGLYGVALACFEEAESREPSGAYWDPPAWSHSLPAQLENHLKLVAQPFGSPAQESAS